MRASTCQASEVKKSKSMQLLTSFLAALVLLLSFNSTECTAPHNGTKHPVGVQLQIGSQQALSLDMVPQVFVDGGHGLVRRKGYRHLRGKGGYGHSGAPGHNCC